MWTPTTRAQRSRAGLVVLDYTATGLTLRQHPLALLRPALPASSQPAESGGRRRFAGMFH